jgi:hypothetical protein
MNKLEIAEPAKTEILRTSRKEIVPRRGHRKIVTKAFYLLFHFSYNLSHLLTLLGL